MVRGAASVPLLWSPTTKHVVGIKRENMKPQKRENMKPDKMHRTESWKGHGKHMRFPLTSILPKMQNRKNAKTSKT